MQLTNKQFDFPSYYQIKHIISENYLINKEWSEFVKTEYFKKGQKLNNREMERISYSFLSDLSERNTKTFELIDGIVSHFRDDIEDLNYTSQAPLAFYGILAGVSAAVLLTILSPVKDEISSQNDLSQDSLLEYRLSEIKENSAKQELNWNQ